ncbi:uncharacterized protein [Musca autumnalis]|uniref:uncharacterized protein n=1 Tax=Musca autumnalis TaxID=221902 RepID=UPI003CF0E563
MRRQFGPRIYVTRRCLLKSTVDHLHEETKILPVRQHNEMLSLQYLLGCYRESHPNHHLLATDTHRHIKKDIHALETTVQQYRREPLDQQAYQTGLNSIHTDTVAKTISNYCVNAVIGAHPPFIAAEERQLPRQTRVVLAQLRSGYCSRLHFYWAGIDRTVQDICPVCGMGPHDTKRLFNCPAKPTHMTPVDLWLHPNEVANFLELEIDPEPD